MKDLKIFIPVVVAALALTALSGASVASASALKQFGGGTSLKKGTEIVASLESGNSTFLEDGFGLTATTCTGSTVKGKIERTTSEKGPEGSIGHPKGKIATLEFTGCSHTVDPDPNNKGELEVRNITGTTNGTVFSSGTKVLAFSTLLNQNCLINTGAGTDIGTLTGATSGFTRATMDINALLPLEGCSASTARWTGKYEITQPIGLVVESS
jgi:hypothetical protein